MFPCDKVSRAVYLQRASLVYVSASLSLLPCQPRSRRLRGSILPMTKLHIIIVVEKPCHFFPFLKQAAGPSFSFARVSDL